MSDREQLINGIERERCYKRLRSLEARLPKPLCWKNIKSSPVKHLTALIQLLEKRLKVKAV